MEFLVVGAGSLGSLLGGLLARKHGVTLVGREPHVGAVRGSGLTVEGAVGAHVTPDARTDVPDGRFDCALVATKAFDTAAAARDLAAAGTSLDAALSLSNGLGNEATLADALAGDCEVLAGTCTYGAMTPEPGTVRCTGVGEVVLGARDGGRRAGRRGHRRQHLLDAAGRARRPADGGRRHPRERGRPGGRVRRADPDAANACGLASGLGARA